MSNNLGGGPYNGYSPKQTVTNYKNSGDTLTRRILRDSWNTNYANQIYTGNNGVKYNSHIGPFRAIMNRGDFLGRVNYVCGGPNQVNANYPGWKSRIGSMISRCDGTGVPASNGSNPKFVVDSSDYITFKRQSAVNRVYNDLAFVGPAPEYNLLGKNSARLGRFM